MTDLDKAVEHTISMQKKIKKFLDMLSEEQDMPFDSSIYIMYILFSEYVKRHSIDKERIERIKKILVKLLLEAP